MPDSLGPGDAPTHAPAPPASPSEPLGAVLSRAAWRALGGGLSGAAAMALQVALLMPLRTVATAQMRHGGAALPLARALLREGGLRRLYAGVAAAALQAPAARFGDTAANAGALALLGSLEATRGLPLAAQTAVASAAAAAFRVLLTPLDAVKVVLQADGAAGFSRLRAAVRAAGPRVLFRGAGAMAANTLAAHYAFFATFNELSVAVPLPPGAGPLARLARNAGIGFAASVASDIVANSLRVVKTVRMTTGHSYADSVRAVLAADGVSGLLTRGLRTRIAANAAQGLLYGAVWRTLDDAWVRKHGDGHSRGGGGAHGGGG